ncbi:MAG: phosphoribosylamine--glycine ligase [Acidimicrobiia bacterium]|nr:MAG: phosphoribosylamine--glycine ligase [Acidimicrobiia bacterium]
MRILLLGSGGREHAIGWKLAQSPRLDRLVSCPGNPGLAQLGDIVPDVDPNDPEAVVALSADREIDLVVIGPEAPLAAGVADALRAAAIPVFGPNADGARLESSKSFAKEVMAAAHVPTARSARYNDREAAVMRLEESDGPYVVKADGLAAGKGVLVTESLEHAITWVDALLGGRFGPAGSSLVIEDYLEGDEISVIYICANEEAIPLEPARDYKRLEDGDTGPNTGGMGSYSPVDDIPDDIVDWTTVNVTLPVLGELARRGIAYTGFLYVGLMITEDGPRVLEFNCRLGDPETQVLMPRLESDLLDILNAGATTSLAGRTLEWSPRSAVDVVLASPGYPDDPETGLTIIGVDRVNEALVFHAGTKQTEAKLLTAGGRVLNVVGVGDTLEEARLEAYAAADLIQFHGKQVRTDIAGEKEGTHQ